MTALDPILPKLTRWYAADAAFQAAHRRAHAKWPNDAVRAEEVANRATWTERERALRDLYGTSPTTLQGLAALTAVYCEEDLEALLDSVLAGRGLRTILRGLQNLANQEACAAERTSSSHRRVNS